MSKNTPSFILNIEIKKTNQLISDVEKELEIHRVMYNTCLGELLKRETQMKRTKKYKKIRRQLRAISNHISFYENKKDKKQMKHFQTEKENVMKQLFELQFEFGLSEYFMHEYIKPIREHFQNRVNIDFAQKTATRAWNTFVKKLKGTAKKVKFVKKDEFTSFEGKKNSTGWMYQNREILYKKQPYRLLIDEKDMYLLEALHYIESGQTFQYKNSKGEAKKSVYKVKYVRIVKKVIRGKVRYYAQLICAGYPPIKRDKFGKEKYPLGKGRVGGDIGTSSVAFVGEEKVGLFNLAEQIKVVDKIQRNIVLLQRKMERSKRTTNPQNFNENGTVKKGKKKWIWSNHYLKLKQKLKELHRKLNLYRRYSHQQLANQLKMWGNEFYIEDMNFKALQKRAKETKISERTGKYQKKKRFGKSIAHRAPSMFVDILKQKIENSGTSFDKVNTWTFKASQYDHKSKNDKKKKLKERWHTFDDGTKVQRDLYSSFLLKNSNKSKNKTNQKLCEQTFECFKVLHDNEIKRLEKLPTITLNSGIKLKNKKATFVASK